MVVTVLVVSPLDSNITVEPVLCLRAHGAGIGVKTTPSR